MNHWKIMKLALIAVEFGFLLCLVSCSNLLKANSPAQSVDSFHSPPEKSSKTSMQNLKIQQSSSGLIEDQMEDMLRQAKLVKNGEVIQELLKEKPKFRKMAETCLPFKSLTDGRIPVYGRITPTTQLEQGLYLVKLSCTNAGRSSNRIRFFIYTDSQGINPKPLKLPVVWTNKMGKPIFEETEDLYGREVSYDSYRKELSINIGCNRADGRITSSTKYRYEKGKFILSEFWQDDASNVECIKKEKLRRLYP